MSKVEDRLQASNGIWDAKWDAFEMDIVSRETNKAISELKRLRSVLAEKDREIEELKAVCKGWEDRHNKLMDQVVYLSAHHNEEATTAYDEISDCRSEIARKDKLQKAAYCPDCEEFLIRKVV